jgi:type I restriction enzyme M protein
MLVENYLWAVVSLPAGMFNPYSGVKTSILLMDKALAKKTNKILFVKVENDGFDLGAQRRLVDKNDLPRALEYLLEYHKAEMNEKDIEYTDFAHAVEKNKIEESSYWSLTGEKYRVDSFIRGKQYDWVDFGDVCDFQGGSQPPKSQFIYAYKKGYVRFVQIRDFGINSVETYIPISKKNKLCEKGDVLIARYGASLGRICRGLSGAYNVALLMAKPNTNHLAKDFLYYLLQSDYVQKKIKLFGDRAAQAGVRPDDLKQIKIPLPPLDVQKAIVAEIDSYQKIIDGARQVVDNYKPTIKIDPEWEIVQLGEICTIIMGQSPPGESYNKQGNGMPLINGPVEFGPTPFSKTIKTKFTTKPTKICNKNDLILCVRGSTTGRMNIAGFDACIGRGVAAIQAVKYQKYINYFISSIQQKIYDLGTCSTFPNITAQELFRIKVPLPPIEEQKKIVAQIETEQEMVNADKKLIEIYQQKIKGKIAEVWGE